MIPTETYRYNNRKRRFIILAIDLSVNFFVLFGLSVSIVLVAMVGIIIHRYIVTVFFIIIVLISLTTIECKFHSPTRSLNNFYVAKASDSPNRGKVSKVMSSAGTTALSAGVYGAFAGTIQVVTLMWLRTTVNYQYRYGVSFTKAIKELYSQGGIMRFYSGFFFALVQGPLSKFGAMASNEGSKVIVSHIHSSKYSHFLTSALGTMFAVCWRFLLMPIDTCKTVLQVDGSKGFVSIIDKVLHGNPYVLFQGSAAAIVTTLVSHYPWFLMYNWLDRTLVVPEVTGKLAARSAFIGLMSSAVSDSCSNVVRVVKTVKQATSATESLTYLQVVQKVYGEGGLRGLFGRGLLTRIAANGAQSMIFTVLWKLLPKNRSDDLERYNKKKNKAATGAAV